ncbi:hypothetical protein HYE67_001877 [Fusarium culmorum]|uniref:Secreted protein n=1 Tax=Fusarium culmorum TaxID=5516 RepID=A0A2T4GSL2_FUSCU|nr:hypothetical protein FCULG_00006057 [Fusarium culmorum]QPC59646.1 hypothetical protein HYE67_001877 [Fusarium culmorum]
MVLSLFVTIHQQSQLSNFNTRQHLLYTYRITISKMHFAVAFTTLTSLAMGVAADPNSKPPPNANVISARIWGDSDCGAKNNDHNLGEVTLHGNDDGKCSKFSDEVKSVKQYEHDYNCKLVLYSDKNCKRGKKDIKDGQCRATSSHFGSYKVECK